MLQQNKTPFKKKKSGWENKKQKEKILEAQKNQPKLLDKWCVRLKENYDAEESTSTNIKIENNETVRSEEIQNFKNLDQESPETNKMCEELESSESNDLCLEKPIDGEESRKIDFNDPTLWDLSSDKFRMLLILHGPEHKDIEVYPDPGTSDGRNFNKSWMYKKLFNGEKQYRKWLFYCEAKKCLFCFPCLLFCKSSTSSFSNKEIGFCKWKQLNPRIPNHEQSKEHINSYTTWKILEKNHKSGQNLIDSDLQKQISEDVIKWRHILKSILKCIMFCAKNNLAFRGTHEKCTDNNKGIFLNLIELVSNYDTTLKTVLNERTKGQISYLSPKIQNEFINILASTVRSKIINNIKTAKYFSIIIDSTPDVSHKDQLCQIIRYVKIENDMVSIEEKFVDFVLSNCKTGEGLANQVLDKLKNDGLDYKNIRGQGYDNGANMSGIYKGMQAHIARINDLAKFVPCAAHSLNLIGVHAASNNVEMVSFFGVVQKLFNFFVFSTRRWEKITALLKTTLKGHSDTRWCSKSRSVSALTSQVNEVIEILKEISEDSSFGDGVATARILLGYIESFNFIFMLIMWEKILNKINIVNNQLQDKTQDIFRSSELLNGLLSSFKISRNNQYNIIVSECKKKCDELGIDPIPKMKRKRRRKILPGETDEGSIFSSEDELKYVYYEVVDIIISQLGDRFENMRSLSSIFYFLNGKNLATMPLENLKKAAADCCIVYNEVDTTQLSNELECFQSQAKIIFKNLESLHHFQVLEGMVKWDLCESYPNITIALRIMLTLPVTVASGERSFSKLKIIKNYLRSSMCQDRLSSLSLLSIENDVFLETDFDSVINEFANVKARKVSII